MSGATRVSLIPIANANRPGVKLRSNRPLNLVIHETSNPAPGANAEMHRRFTHQGGGPSNVSFHYVVDEKESIQLLPDNEVGWHAGDGNGPGNHESVGIETCVNAGADFGKAVDNLVALVKHLMVEFKIPVERVKQHHDFSSYKKNCPTKLRANNEAGWKAFIARLQSAPQPPQPPAWPIKDGPQVSGKFLEFFMSHGGLDKGIRLFGLPLSEPRTETVGGTWTGTVQYFQRARFELHVQDGQEFMMLGLVGAEVWKTKG